MKLTELISFLQEAYEFHNAGQERLSRYLRAGGSEDGEACFDLRLARDRHERFANALSEAINVLKYAHPEALRKES
jgi:hypothetical protein